MRPQHPAELIRIIIAGVAGAVVIVAFLMVTRALGLA